MLLVVVLVVVVVLVAVVLVAVVGSAGVMFPLMLPLKVQCCLNSHGNP